MSRFAAAALSKFLRRPTRLLISRFRTAAIIARRTRQLTLGTQRYTIRTAFINKLAVTDSQTREPWLDALYRAMLRCHPGGFLDVGANIGQTMFKLLTIDNTRQYIGLEPQIPCCFLIHTFIQDNNLPHHLILPLGLSKQNQLVELRIRGGNYDSSASIVANFRPDTFYKTSEYVCVRNGDELIAELGSPSIGVIKIDVEGAELEVITGLLSTIRNTSPFIVFEVLNYSLAMTGEQLDEGIVQFREGRLMALESILRTEGYDIYNILPGDILRKVSRIQPLKSMDLSMTNYVAVPKTKIDPLVQSFQGHVNDAE